MDEMKKTTDKYMAEKAEIAFVSWQRHSQMTISHVAASESVNGAA